MFNRGNKKKKGGKLENENRRILFESIFLSTIQEQKDKLSSPLSRRINNPALAINLVFSSSNLFDIFRP